MRPEVETILKQWLKKSIIKPSQSEWASQMVIIRKKTGDLRICVDYRQLNRKTIKEAFPIPRIEESIEALGGARMFCCLDFNQAYLQMPLHKDDAHKTVFRAAGNLYAFTRLPFGLCNAPASFSQFMNMYFGDINYKYIIIYLDDVLAHSKTVSEMLERLEIVFERIKVH